MATRQIYFTSRIARATIQIDDLINMLYYIWAAMPIQQTESLIMPRP